MRRRALPVVAGFRWAGVKSGASATRRGPDLALLLSDRPASVAGVFTRSTLPGAPVVLTRKRVRRGRARALLVNAGVANVALGARGLRDAETLSTATAKQLGLQPEEVLLASTGVIGAPLPMPALQKALPRVVRGLAPQRIEQAARAILTTDRVPKLAAGSFGVGARRHTVAGIAKGAGMIEPNMATLLAFVVTDVAVAPPLLRGLWRDVVEQSFNRISIDGETSTSDMALLFANGAAGGRPLTSSRGAGARTLAAALLQVSEELARALVRDGEGATRLVTVVVRRAKSDTEAERAARRIANSLLVKTAASGGDPNWGRILQTVAAASVRLDERRLCVWLCGVPVCRGGVSTGPAARRRAGQKLKRREVRIEVELGVGAGRAQLWTCDLSAGYVRINADYTT